MDYTQAKALLSKHGQSHLLDYYDELTPSERRELLSDIEKIDFSVLQSIGGKANKKRGKITPATAVSVEEIERDRKKFEDIGLELLSRGKVAAVLLAGGQGSRLGFDGPKGMFDIGKTRRLSIFEQQMDNIFEVTKRYGGYFHIFVMTSAQNNSTTIKFFKDNNYFGYPEEKIHFYEQAVAPTCNFDGKIFLDTKCRVSFAPNGNGGWYSSLVKSGLSKVLEKEGVEWLNIYGVDNVLQRICDPAFIGATVAKNCACGSKVVKKVSPEEKVGILCYEDGKPSIVEYYDADEQMKNQRDGDGELTYRYGVTLNYLFKVKDLNAVIDAKLPYHDAKKAIAHIENGVRVTPSEPCGYKFETLVVDMVRFMDGCLGFEVVREREFAPVKNATGADSVESARKLLELNGVKL